MDGIPSIQRLETSIHRFAPNLQAAQLSKFGYDVDIMCVEVISASSLHFIWIFPIAVFAPPIAEARDLNLL